jgi:hypothetical protein
VTAMLTVELQFKISILATGSKLLFLRCGCESIIFVLLPVHIRFVLQLESPVHLEIPAALYS